MNEIMKESLPNFICVGANKAGTTSLQELLKQHPDVYLPEEKEIHYFDNDKSYGVGIEWYQKYYHKFDGQKAVGDISPC